MEITFEGFNIRSCHAQRMPSRWGADASQHHVITVQRNGHKAHFNYWASKASPSIDTEEDLLSAFACYVSDASYADYDLDDMFSELGFEKPSDAIRTLNACKKAGVELKRMYDGDICELLEKLDDYR